MTKEQEKIAVLVAKDEIRELAMLYSRGVDRKDSALLRTLYTDDASDTHGDTFDGPANDYVDFLEKSFPYMRYSGHHICNHLISIDGDLGEGEVYALAYHLVPDREVGWVEDLRMVRYIDQYRKDDTRWRFSKRVVTYDFISTTPAKEPEGSTPPPEADPSYKTLVQHLFKRGARV